MEQNFEVLKLEKAASFIEHTLQFSDTELKDNKFFTWYSIILGIAGAIGIPLLLMSIGGDPIKLPIIYQKIVFITLNLFAYVWVFLAHILKYNRRHHRRAIRSNRLRRSIELLIENPTAETLGTILALGYVYPAQTYYKFFMCDISNITSARYINEALIQALNAALCPDVQDIGTKGVERLNGLLKKMTASSFRGFDPEIIDLTLKVLRKFGNQTTQKIAIKKLPRTPRYIRSALDELGLALAGNTEESNLLHI